MQPHIEVAARFVLSASISPRLYLASASPRRRELLTQIGLAFLPLPQTVDETWRQGESAEGYVQRVAGDKARAGWQDSRRVLDLPVLAADTSVVCDGEVLGKPGSLQEARSMLLRLSGRSHCVLTAVALVWHERHLVELVSTEVSFRPLLPAEVDAYWHSGEPQDKAGGYGIQGMGALFVSGIVGSYSNVVGLPLFETARLLEQFGVSSLALLKERVA
jgi:septum formation protein